MCLFRYDYDYQNVPADQWDKCYSILESISDSGVYYSMNPPRTGYILVDKRVDISTNKFPDGLCLNKVE